ncbi:hypothetical protein GCM10010174_03000 [Kutzneria viridogrisea]|uniref:Uncharacterized protein n=2 Tax=Kutzneria TaxID=43356 RepID=W5W9C1_9PSEU|nr:hypothetical protein [Kutzneria albida]AHH97562.1 hypothetical protein KALB_4199 [Kutzneria albida DSM 43870]MBA8924816.1 hypothetical protein [Kutzneria viridogrisea]MBA8930501.1 hypothetical protein [Kutzneria viridogrisea]
MPYPQGPANQIEDIRQLRELVLGALSVWVGFVARVLGLALIIHGVATVIRTLNRHRLPCAPTDSLADGSTD